MTVRAAWLLSVGQTREDTRHAPLGVMAPAGELTTRPGVIPGGNPLAATGAGAMQVQLGLGRAVVQGTAAQGAYPVAVVAPELLTVPDGHAQYDRVDSLVLRVHDGLFDVSEQTLAAVELLPGEPDASPEPPTLPSAALRLWDIRVPAGTSAGTGGINWSSALADRRTYTAVAGGIVPRDATSAPGAYVGQLRDTGEWVQRWDGAEWRDYPARPTWSSWSPTWTTSNASAVSFGNSSRTWRYVRDGMLVHFAFELTFGDTARLGGPSGNWRFTLPVPSTTGTTTIGWAELTASNTRRVTSRLTSSGAYFELEISSGLPGGGAVDFGGLADVASPWAWAAGQSIRGNGTYEAAT